MMVLAVEEEEDVRSTPWKGSAVGRSSVPVVGLAQQPKWVFQKTPVALLVMRRDWALEQDDKILGAMAHIDLEMTAQVQKFGRGQGPASSHHTASQIGVESAGISSG